MKIESTIYNFITPEDKEFIDQIYKNISEINNKFSNVDTITDQYIKLI